MTHSPHREDLASLQRGQAPASHGYGFGLSRDTSFLGPNSNPNSKANSRANSVSNSRTNSRSNSPHPKPDYSSLQRGQGPASHGYGFGPSRERPFIPSEHHHHEHKEHKEGGLLNKIEHIFHKDKHEAKPTNEHIEEKK